MKINNEKYYEEQRETSDKQYNMIDNVVRSLRYKMLGLLKENTKLINFVECGIDPVLYKHYMDKVKRLNTDLNYIISDLEQSVNKAKNIHSLIYEIRTDINNMDSLGKKLEDPGSDDEILAGSDEILAGSDDANSSKSDPDPDMKVQVDFPEPDDGYQEAPVKE